jgi:MFS family permease
MGSVRSEQTAALVVFSVTGLVSATWAARIPDTQAQLNLSMGQLALAVLAIEGGALLGLPAGGALVSRLGSRWSLWLGLAIYPTMLAPLAIAPSLGWLAGLLVIWAGANSLVDVAMNAAGVELEGQLRRPMLSRLHAAQSGGLLVGGLAATGAATGHLSLLVHFGVIAAAGGLAALLAASRLPAGATRRHTPILIRPEKRLMLLGAVAFCAFLIDGGASYWAAVHLRNEQHSSAAVAAAAYTLLTAAMAFARLFGDWARARFGRVRIVQCCGVTAAGGALLVVLASTAAIAMTGWVIIGVGLAALAPTVVGAAPSRATKTTPAAAIAAVTTLGYLGSFTGPPIVGGLASLIGLSAALGLLAAAGGIAALMAPVALRGSPERAQLHEPAVSRS